MNRMRKKNAIPALLALLVFLCGFGPVTGTLAEELPRRLSEALDLLGEDNPEGALKRVESYLRGRKKGAYVQVAELLAGRCELALGRTAKTIDRALTVINEDPFGGMTAQAYYLLATAHQKRGDSYEAARALVGCLDSAPDENVAEMAAFRLNELARGPAGYRIGTLRLLARSGRSRSVLDSIQPSAERTPRLGVVIATRGEEDSLAKALAVGVQAGIESWNAKHRQDVELETNMVQGGSINSVLAVREMVREHGVWGLILGGTETEVFAGAVEAQASGVPVILPGQRHQGLYAAGQTTIMPEADWYREGEIAAIYAADSLAMRSFVVVAPATDLGTQTVAGFREALERRDSTEIVALEWYFPEEGVSLSRQFQRIREIAFRRNFIDSLRADSVMVDSLWSFGWWDYVYHIEDGTEEAEAERGMLYGEESGDSLVALDSVWIDSVTFDSTLFEKLWSARIDSVLRSQAYKSGRIDSNAIELASIDAFYFPIEPGSIELFAPQYAFYNFRALKMGNSAWYEHEEIYRHRQYVEDLVITAPYCLEYRSNEMIDLSRRLKRLSGDKPGPWQLRGYDAVMLLLKAMEAGGSGPWGVASGVSGLEMVKLAAGYQVFDPNHHVGLGMWLLTFVEGVAVVEDVEVRREKLAETPIKGDESPEDTAGR